MTRGGFSIRFQTITCARCRSKRVRGIRVDGQAAPLNQRRNPHERVLSDPLPHLSVHSCNNSLHVLSPITVHKYLNVLAARATVAKLEQIERQPQRCASVAVHLGIPDPSTPRSSEGPSTFVPPRLGLAATQSEPPACYSERRP